MNKTEECFAKSEDGKSCYALTEMKCENCSFYKPKSQVTGYSRFSPKEKNNKDKNNNKKLDKGLDKYE